MPFRLYRLLQPQPLPDLRRSTQEALPKNPQLACRPVKEAVVVDLTARFDLVQLHAMDESAVSHQQRVVPSHPLLLRTLTFDKSQEPADRLGTAAPPRSSLWKITMPQSLALQQLQQLQNLTLVELADPYAQVPPDCLRSGENQVKIEDASLACRRHSGV